MPLSADICPMLTGIGNSGLNDLTRSFYAGIIKSTRDTFFAKGNKFPKQCPINPVRYLLINIYSLKILVYLINNKACIIPAIFIYENSLE